MTTSYREQFSSPEQAKSYQTVEYAPGSYSRLLWEMEKPVLDAQIINLRVKRARVEALDFASGTGRIAAHLASTVDDLTAIEISAAMAALASDNVPTAKVVCKDITASDDSIEGRYDLITAFRFFLNAEPSLRQPAMKALVKRLRDETSLLIFNNHGNLLSIKILGWPVHRLRRLGAKRQNKGNYLSHSDIKILLQDSGLQIVDRIGMGILGGRICSWLGYDRALRWERRLARLPLIARFGQDILYVTKKK